jgi:hypothetical protein
VNDQLLEFSNSKDYLVREIPFNSGDGFKCNLINIRGQKFPWKEPVILVHGAGVRANIFLAPVRETLVDRLIAEGYDVWLENWRASIEFSPNPYTLDQAAAYDHPQAVKTIIKETGAKEIKAIIHCQGSTSFMMSAVAGLLPEVSTIITNAVSLHPIVPKLSKFKIFYAIPFVHKFTEYLNPQWGIKAPTIFAKMLKLFVNMVHHECDNAVCKQVSFTYGSGFPALWRHENLDENTHEWLKHEFAHVPISFYLQMAKCVKKGNLVTDSNDIKSLPSDFVKDAPKTKARMAFFAGDKNLCFLADSQVKTFEYFNNLRKNYHTLHVIPGYSHLDIFMGKNASSDIFPLMLKELNATT